MEPHLSYAPGRPTAGLSLTEVFQFLPPRFEEAAVQVARVLESLGIRYALAGGLAVGAYGHVQATKGIDFLVGDEVFERHGAMVTFTPGVPIQVAGVTIDYLSGPTLGLPIDEVLKSPPRSAGLPVVPINALVQMKLKARRKQDQADVIGLLKAGAEFRSIRRHLESRAPDLLPLFEELLEEAG